MAGIIKSIIGKLGGGASLALLLMLAGAALLYSCEAQKTEAQAREIAALACEVQAVSNERDLLRSGNRELAEQHARDMERLAALAEKSDMQAAANTRLHSQLMEALKHERPVNVHGVLSDGVTDALCLRWHIANGYLSPGGHGAGTAGALPSDTAAALCAGWRGRLTVESVIEWAGLLMDYAGTDVAYNAARRERRAEAGHGGK